jgi:2-amino-4-hydroxy-6-hydroxymethyldihydropteridine diphosphokinase
MRCGIALGSNVGDRLANLREAFRHLLGLGSSAAPVLASSIYETEPVDCEPGTKAYLNAVVEIDFSGSPLELLDRLIAIEQQMGRPSKRPRNAPRIIDLDILYAGNLVLDHPEIIVPHPRLHRRRFVLEPLNEIRPELVAPGLNRSVRELLAELTNSGKVTRTTEALDDRHQA